MSSPNYSAFDLSPDNFFSMLLLSPSLCAETDHGASDDAAAAATAADNDEDESGGDSVNHARGKKRKEVNVANHNLSSF